MTDLDVAISEALARRALASNPTAPPLSTIADRHRRQARRRAARAGGIAACCVVGAAVGVGVLSTNDRASGPNPVATASVEEPATTPAPNPTLQGWAGTFVSGTSDSDRKPTFSTFVLENDHQRVVLSFFLGDVLEERLQPGMSAPLTAAGMPATPLELRGTTGFVPGGYPMEDLSKEDDMAPPGATRVLWFEDGWTIDASGIGITSTDELLGLIADLEPYSA